MRIYQTFLTLVAACFYFQWIGAADALGRGATGQPCRHSQLSPGGNRAT